MISGQRHHWTIQSLTYTMQLDNQTADTLDAIRRLRGVSDYDRISSVPKKRIHERVDWAVQERNAVNKRLYGHHSELIGT